MANTRVGMQRAGLLIAACEAAADRRPSQLDRVASKTLDLVKRDVPVSGERLDMTSAYLGSLRLWKRYGRRETAQLAEGDLMQVQDLWLADPEMPSATGALTPENATEIPQLAIGLRFLRDNNLTRTDRARALLVATGRERLRALRDAALEPNPLRLTAGAQLLILAALLEADGDFLQSTWRTTPTLNSDDFTRADFASGLAGACADLRTRGRRLIRTGADQRLLSRLKEWEDAVAKERKSGSDWGGGRPPDQMATVRLEPFVDVGIITRKDRYAYHYKLAAAQRTFLRQLADAGNVDEFSRSCLVAGWLKASGRSATPATRDETWAAMRDVYGELRSALGFAAFAEVVLVAAGRLIDSSPPRWFELQDGIDVLSERRRESPKDVRLGINRAGELTYMKLSETARAS